MHQRDGQINSLERFQKQRMLWSPKNLEDHWKKLQWTTEEFFPWWRKTPSQLLGNTKNLHQEVQYIAMSHSQQSREDFSSLYRGLPTRCKQQASLNNRKTRLEFARAFVPEWWEEKSMKKERHCSRFLKCFGQYCLLIFSPVYMSSRKPRD